MIEALNAAYIKYLPKVSAFRRTHLPNLFRDTVKHIDEMWRLKGNPLLTLGFDGYTSNCNTSVLNITETAGDSTAFKNSIDPGERREDARWIAATVCNEMMKVEYLDPPKSVEDVYAGCVADNVSVNRSAFEKIERIYPKLLCVGCCTHASDLLIEDVCEKIKEFKEVVKSIRTVVTFIRSHRCVKAAYKRLAKTVDPPGTMPTLYPKTRFSYADLTLQSYERNYRVIQLLTDEETFDSSTLEGVNVDKAEEFKEIVEGYRLLDKVKALRLLTGPLCKIIHHLEKGKTRASWIYPLFEAFYEHMKWWKDNSSVVREFDGNTRSKVMGLFNKRWNGEGNLVPLKNDVFITAYVFDPYYTPVGTFKDNPELGVSWISSITSILKRYYSTEELHDAKSEVFRMILRRGHWGDEIKARQQSMLPPATMTFGASKKVEKVIWQQDQMTSVRDCWEVISPTEFPLTSNLGARFEVLTVQSANVERVCKAHGVIHTKSRNRLKHQSVQMLLFCYVNLRLLKKESSKVAQFLLGALNDDEDDDGENNREQLQDNGLDEMDISDEEVIDVDEDDNDESSDEEGSVLENPFDN